MDTASSVAELLLICVAQLIRLAVLLLQNSFRVETIISSKIYYTSMSGSREMSGKKKNPAGRKY